ncbi:MAG: hypothetical protein IT378_21465 [Sandaracinaceae bacterium]|nr:hypothetical protein [Sandaracinaceae bacterium]
MTPTLVEDLLNVVRHGAAVAIRGWRAEALAVLDRHLSALPEVGGVAPPKARDESHAIVSIELVVDDRTVDRTAARVVRQWMVDASTTLLCYETVAPVTAAADLSFALLAGDDFSGSGQPWRRSIRRLEPPEFGQAVEDWDRLIEADPLMAFQLAAAEWLAVAGHNSPAVSRCIASVRRVGEMLSDLSAAHTLRYRVKVSSRDHSRSSLVAIEATPSEVMKTASELSECGVGGVEIYDPLGQLLVAYRGGDSSIRRMRVEWAGERCFLHSVSGSSSEPICEVLGPDPELLHVRARRLLEALSPLAPYALAVAGGTRDDEVE